MIILILIPSCMGSNRLKIFIYLFYYDCTGQAAAADRALIYNKSLINYGTHN